MEYTAEQQQYQQQYQYQQQPSAAAYDPSQYDQSAAYYAYANQNQYQYDQQQYQYSYSQQYSQFYQEAAAAPIHPPGVPLDAAALQNQPTVYYQPQPAMEEPQKQQVIPVLGSNSTDANANFAGNMDNPPPQMQPAHRGGRRGGRAFRGRGRGHVHNRGLRPDGSAPPHNTGRGQSGSRHFPSNGVPSAAVANSQLDPSDAAAVMPPSASVPSQAALPTQVPAAPVWPPPRMAWCELCRVDCNRPEILEQHKNGKRHKKNLKLHEEMQKLNKVIAGQQGVPVPYSGSEVVQLEKVEGSEEKQQQQEILPSLAVTNDIVNNSEASTTDSAEAKRKPRDPIEARGRGSKRKMRGGRGGKYMKSNEGSRRPMEPPKHKGGIPFMCELCNVKCESQVVFNSHLAGKKHIANLKRFQGHRALYGDAGLQALYPPNFNGPSPSFIPQIQQGITDPQVVLAQLLTYVLSQAQLSGLAAAQIPLPAATLPAAYPPVLSSENLYPQGSLATSEVKSGEAVKAESETWQQPRVEESQNALSLAGNNKAESQTSEFEKIEMSQQQYVTSEFEVPQPAGTDVKAASTPMDNPILATSEYRAADGELKPSSAPEKDARTECKTVSLDPVCELGSNNNLEQPEEDSEEQDPKGQTE